MTESQTVALHNSLRQFFGFTEFKADQLDVITPLMENRDVLAVMPTGAGKSLCFQIPALSLPGMALVISPLISLMKDQVDTLAAGGISASFLNSSQSSAEYYDIAERVRQGECKLLYVAPERLEMDGFLRLISGVSISLVAVDEAHCVSQWGHDFRPSYLRIASMIAALPNRPPVAAYTATATPQVRSDIIRQLELRDPLVHVAGCDRENLFFEVRRPHRKLEETREYVRQTQGSGIIYCSTRKTVESVCQMLEYAGESVTRYHAGLSDAERIRNQENFQKDRARICVATNAFGMGIDKSDIRFVLHYNMPKSMEHYYQEAGRAGRDGEFSECVLLYGANDMITNRMLIENSETPNADHTTEYKKLQQMADYCHTDGCLRGVIRTYFGETPPERCDNCANCQNPSEMTDITVQTQKILSCVRRMGERYGSTLVCRVLRGQANEQVRMLGFDKLSTYGIMEGETTAHITAMIRFLGARGFLETATGQYPTLSVTEAGYRWLTGKTKTLSMPASALEESDRKERSRERTSKKSRGGKPVNTEMFETLRALRAEIAKTLDVPPYVVFSDATLRDMCERNPATREEMMMVTGMGPVKWERYGEGFLKCIRDMARDKTDDADVVRTERVTVHSVVKVAAPETGRAYNMLVQARREVAEMMGCSEDEVLEENAMKLMAEKMERRLK